MPNAYALVQDIKRAAVEAVEAAKPVNLCFGVVIQTTPLIIEVEQRLQLAKEQLALCRNITDYNVEMSVDHVTESDSHAHSCSGDGCGMSTNTHKHAYKGRKNFTVHNGLVVGEKVALIKMQGGQKYIVLDRVVEM